MRLIRSLLLGVTALWATASLALEYPIGSPQNLAAMDRSLPIISGVSSCPSTERARFMWFAAF